MSETKLTQEDVQQILRLIQSAEHVAEFRLKFGDVEIGLSRSNADASGLAGDREAPVRRAAAGGASAHAPEPTPQAPSRQAPQKQVDAAPSRGAEVDAGMAVVKAPMVGTFYRAPAPGAPAFVEVGQRVEADATVCIIEVMKLMNSIPAGVRGTVREIRIGDAQPVEFGQVLIVIEPEG